MKREEFSNLNPTYMSLSEIRREAYEQGYQDAIKDAHEDDKNSKENKK